MAEMTPRERVQHALSHREVDRVPIDLGGTQNSTLCAGAFENLARFLGLDAGAATLSLSFETVRLPEAMLARLPVDTRSVYARPPATDGARIGAVRTLTYVDGNAIVERLEDFDDATRGLSYALLTDTPFRHCLITVTAHDPDRGWCGVTWSVASKADWLPLNSVLLTPQDQQPRTESRPRLRLAQPRFSLFRSFPPPR